MQRKRMTPQERKNLRALEIKKKVDVLRGRMGERYRRERDKEKANGGEDPKAAEQQGEEEEEEEEEEEAAESTGAEQRRLKDDEDEGGEGQAEWVFERRQTARSRVPGQEKVSEDARAVAAAEAGTAGTASSRQLLDAAEEFGFASEHEQALSLAEAARPRIDREMLDRKLGFLDAQALDDRALWQIAKSCEALGRLTLAVEMFRQLKDKLRVQKEQQLAEQSWARAAYKLSEKLYNAMRFKESLQVLELVTETTKKSIIGDRLYEEVQLYAAMALQQLGRLPEAKEILENVQRSTSCKQTKAQAAFVLDVFSVDTEGYRNEEFHKMWEANFKLPEDSYGSQVRVGLGGGGSSLQLSDREREWRAWASTYWEERMKSPLYYAFLTLWVTWPFAIPVISIMKKVQVVTP